MHFFLIKKGCTYFSIKIGRLKSKVAKFQNITERLKWSEIHKLPRRRVTSVASFGRKIDFVRNRFADRLRLLYLLHSISFFKAIFGQKNEMSLRKFTEKVLIKLSKVQKF